jgi:hypothetical protein
MSDPSSVNFKNSSLDYGTLSNPVRLTGNRVADGLTQGIKQSSENKAFIADLPAMDASSSAQELDFLPDDRTLGKRLVMEREASRYPQHLDDIKSVSKEIPREAVGLSSPSLAPDQISSFANAVQISQVWTESKGEISPLHEKYLAERSRLVDGVMENKLSTVAALFFTPPLGLAALMKYKSSQKALQQISEKQVNFLAQAIKGDASNPPLKQILANTAQALDFLNGLSLDTVRQVAFSGSPAAPTLKLALGLYNAALGLSSPVDKSDSTVNAFDRIIVGDDIAKMRGLLSESTAVLDKPVEEIQSKINSRSAVALEIFVQAMTDVPAYITARYNKLRDPLKGLLSEDQSEKLTGFLGDVTSRVKRFFVAEADKVVKVVDQNANAAQNKMKRDLTQIVAQISDNPELQKIVGDANHGLQTQVAPLMQEIAKRAGGAIQEQLNQASNNIVSSKFTNNKPNSN